MTARRHRSWHRELAAKWSANPIEFCEVRLDGCFGTYGLHPAHSLKRRFIDTKEKFFEVVAACGYCGAYLDEKMSHEEMEATVKRIIDERDAW